MNLHSGTAGETLGVTVQTKVLLSCGAASRTLGF